MRLGNSDITKKIWPRLADGLIEICSSIGRVEAEVLRGLRGSFWKQINPADHFYFFAVARVLAPGTSHCASADDKRLKAGLAHRGHPPAFSNQPVGDIVISYRSERIG